MNDNKEKTNLGIEIAWAGGWEEFHQKRHETEMYQYWKDRRLELQKRHQNLSRNY